MMRTEQVILSPAATERDLLKFYMKNLLVLPLKR